MSGDHAAALAAADDQMRLAKARFSAAALACLRNAPDAAAQVQAALREVDAARQQLQGLHDAAVEGDKSPAAIRSTRG